MMTWRHNLGLYIFGVQVLRSLDDGKVSIEQIDLTSGGKLRIPPSCANSTNHRKEVKRTIRNQILLWFNPRSKVFQTNQCINIFSLYLSYTCMCHKTPSPPNCEYINALQKLGQSKNYVILLHHNMLSYKTDYLIIICSKFWRNCVQYWNVIITDE